MKKFLIVLALAALPAGAVEVKDTPSGGVTITLTAEEAKNCEKEGGCILISSNALARAMEVIVERACGREAKF